MMLGTFWVCNVSSALIRFTLTACISYDARDNERDKQDETSVISLTLDHLTQIC